MVNGDLVRLRLLTSNKRLAEARKEKGFTQIMLSKLIGINKNKLQAIETLRCIPTIDQIADIADLLEKPIEYLFPDSLLDAIKTGVFTKREANLGEPEVLYLSQVSQKLLPSYNPEDDLIEEADRDLLRGKLGPILETLKPREQRVIELRFGLDGHGSRTLEEVGKFFGVTREAIRRNEAKALRKLRHPSRSRLLKKFLD